MFGLIKKNKDGIKQQKTNIKSLFAELSLAMDLVEALNSDELLDKLGLTREQVVNKVKSDDEVESCLIDLRAAMSASNWRIWGDEVDDEKVNPLYKNIRKHLPTLIELAVTAKLNGYAVAEYVYYEDETSGLFLLDRIIDKDGELQNYRPRRDGRLIFTNGLDELSLDLQVKHLLLTYLATASRPSGISQAAKLYPAIQLRSLVLPYAGQFIRRYAQPFVIGKQGGLGELKKFINDLFGFINGGALALGKDDEVSIHQLRGDAKTFRTLEQMANTRIQKLLLGKVKTAELETGSRAAQETEEENRIERISEYLALLSIGAQHAIDALLAVNAGYGTPINAPNGLWFEFEDEIKINTNRAARDKHYLDSGQIRLTKDYFTQILGFEEDHIEMVSSAVSESQNEPRLSAPYFLSDDNNPPLDTEQIRMMQPKIDALMQALGDSKDYADFENKLSTLDIGDHALIQALARQNAIAYTEGATDDSEQ